MRKVSLRPARFDDLGLRRALSDRLMPALVAAMAFLAALALAGAVAAASLAAHWREGAAAAMTVQVPHPGEAAAAGAGSRVDRVLAVLRDSRGSGERPRRCRRRSCSSSCAPGSAARRAGSPCRLPAVIQVRLATPAPDLDALAARVTATAPGTIVEGHGVWMQRLTVLARSLQACAGLAVVLVALVAAAVIAVATRAGLVARRDAIEIVHGLGATDGYMAARFAGRTTLLASVGAVIGAAASLPVLLALSGIAAPFAAPAASAPGLVGAAWSNLPGVLWFAVPALPLAAAVIGWLTAQRTVRAWLRRLA